MQGDCHILTFHPTKACKYVRNPPQNIPEETKELESNRKPKGALAHAHHSSTFETRPVRRPCTSSLQTNKEASGLRRDKNSAASDDD